MSFICNNNPDVNALCSKYEGTKQNYILTDTVIKVWQNKTSVFREKNYLIMSKVTSGTYCVRYSHAMPFLKFLVQFLTPKISNLHAVLLLLLLLLLLLFFFLMGGHLQSALNLLKYVLPFFNTERTHALIF